MFIITIAPANDPNDAFANDFADVPALPTVETYADKATAFARATSLWDANERAFRVQEITIAGLVERLDYPHDRNHRR